MNTKFLHDEINALARKIMVIEKKLGIGNVGKIQCPLCNGDKVYGSSFVDTPKHKCSECDGKGWL